MPVSKIGSRETRLGYEGSLDFFRKDTGAVLAGNPYGTNDASGTYQVIDNRMITDINIGTTTDGYTFTLALSCGNILTGLNGVAATIPFAVTAE
jgi:hypothetical protein